MVEAPKARSVELSSRENEPSVGVVAAGRRPVIVLEAGTVLQEA